MGGTGGCVCTQCLRWESGWPWVRGSGGCMCPAVSACPAVHVHTCLAVCVCLGVRSRAAGGHGHLWVHPVNMLGPRRGRDIPTGACGTTRARPPASFPTDETGASPCQACNSRVKKRCGGRKHAYAPRLPCRGPQRSPVPAGLSCPPCPDVFIFSSSSISGCVSQAGGQNLRSCTHPLESSHLHWGALGSWEGPVPCPCSL